jgi:phosphohistidine phosphatase
MKKLLIVRHAKSSREYSELTDFERPLSVKGRASVPLMGELVKKNRSIPDLIISSPANRALSTARLMAEQLGYPLTNIRVEERIYEAWLEDLLEVLRKQDTAKKTIMLVGHNPGLQLLADFLAGFPHDNLPTCGIVCMELEVDTWDQLEQDSGKILFFESPKKLSKL